MDTVDLQMLAEGRNFMLHGGLAAKLIKGNQTGNQTNQWKSKSFFSKFPMENPILSQKNPKNFPLASLATHEEEFSAQNARFFGPKKPRRPDLFYKNRAK